MPSFAASEEGQEIVALHLLGYPLAQTQGDLTEMQAAFLLEALPPAIEKMHGGMTAQSGSQQRPAPRNRAAHDLFQQMQARQKGRRT